MYWLEDFVDELWKGRPEWARPAVGGVALGVVLLALPQMYGVGYPVMGKAFAGQYALWFIAVLMLGKILAASLTLSIGGSGGVFAPSLFIGAMAGMAFGTVAHHLFGPAIGPPAMYAVVAMGGVFAAAAQAPLTAIASVVEMTGNFGLTLPIMLAAGIAAAVSKHLSYGSIYTTKLLRRGIDIERPKTTSVLQTLTVADVMQPAPQLDGDARLRPPEGDRGRTRRDPGRAVGESRRPGNRHPPPRGAVRRRDTRARAATAHPARPRRAAGDLPRRAASARLDHPPGRASGARPERELL